MERQQTMALNTVMALGVGYSSTCSAAEIVALIGQVCDTHAVDLSEVKILATVAERALGAQLIEAAEQLGLALVIPPEAKLRAAAPYCLSRSERIRERFDLPSIAEAAALAAIPDGRLLGPRIRSARATCALAAIPTDDRTETKTEAIP
jgi:cobalt-precorrin 5A hydrolase